MYSREYDPGIGQACTYCDPANIKDDDRPIAVYRCYDCIQPPPMCKNCMISSHKWNPYHRIEMWSKTHFVKRSLYDLGFVHYLGHFGDKCKFARAPVKTTVVHVNGVQNCLVSYCGCSATTTDDDECSYRPVQLLKSGLYPASFKRTQTAFTIQVLKTFHHLTLQAKLTAFDYYKVIRRLTNNAFFQDCQDRYREFMAAHRQYAFLRALRWNNQRADQPLSSGSLAVLCPACPQLGINMDPNWRNCKEEHM